MRFHRGTLLVYGALAVDLLDGHGCTQINTNKKKIKN
jgi:hypothetical protein